MTTSLTIEEQQGKALAAERAMEAEIAEMEERLRHLAFDAMGDAKVRASLGQLESDLESRRRALEMARIAIAEGERRLAVRATEEAEAERGDLEAERARIADTLDARYLDIERHIAALGILVPTAMAVDGDLKNAEQRLGISPGRRAVDILSAHVGFHLTRAGLHIGEGMLHPTFGGPISNQGQQAVQQSAERNDQ